MSKITAILPSLNVGKYIRQCLESVAEQTLKDIEIICIDAGSTDGTLDILKGFEETDHRITVVHSEVKSYGYQVNMGLKQAKGDYIWIVETDDYLDLWAFQTLYAYAERTGFPDIVKAGYFSVTEHDIGTAVERRFHIRERSGEVFRLDEHYELLDTHPSIWSCIYRKEFLTGNQIFMKEAPGAGWVDNPFFFQTLCEAKTICWVDDTFYYYRDHMAGSSSEIKDCTVPIDRINDIKDYLEEAFPENSIIENSLLRRALLYYGKIRTNDNFSSKNLSAMKELLSRFDLQKHKKEIERAVVQYPELFSGSGEIGIHWPAWAFGKFRSGIQCYKDNGLQYTLDNMANKVKAQLPRKKEKDRGVFGIDKKSLRVLFIASDNNKTSGAFISMTMLNYLLQKEHGVETFVVLPGKGTGTQLLEEKGIKYTIIPSKNWAVSMKQVKSFKHQTQIGESMRDNEDAEKALCALIKREKFDIVHINTSYSYVGALAALKSKTPLVWHIREFLEEDQGNTLWDRGTGGTLINKADRVVAISDAIYRKYLTWVDAGRLVRIYNGIDHKAFYSPDRIILDKDTVEMVMVGGFEYYKGQIEFSKACVKAFASGHKNIRIRFIGTGKEEVRTEVARILTEGGLEKRVEFLGYKNNVGDYLKEADLSFTCAASEAFGRTTVEAMMAGALVIGADTAGTKELIESGKTGYLYESGNVDDLYKVIVKALQNIEKSREIAKRGQVNAMTKYTAKKNASNIYNTYLKILEERKTLGRRDVEKYNRQT